MANVGVAVVHGSEVNNVVGPVHDVNQSVVNARDEMVVDASVSVLADVVVLLVVAVEKSDSCSATGRSSGSSGSFW